MASYQITCIIPDGADDDRRIDRLGGNGPSGRWEDSIDNIIAFIGQGHDFWTQVAGRRVDVMRRTHPTSGRLYLTTEGDGFPPNNLLSLPRC